MPNITIYRDLCPLPGTPVGMSWCQCIKRCTIEMVRRIYAQFAIVLLALITFASTQCIASCQFQNCSRPSASSHTGPKPSSCHNPKQPPPQRTGNLCGLEFIATADPSDSLHPATVMNFRIDACSVAHSSPHIIGSAKAAMVSSRQDIGPPAARLGQFSSILRI